MKSLHVFSIIPLLLKADMRRQTASFFSSMQDSQFKNSIQFGVVDRLAQPSGIGFLLCVECSDQLAIESALLRASQNQVEVEKISIKNCMRL